MTEPDHSRVIDWIKEERHRLQLLDKELTNLELPTSQLNLAIEELEERANDI